MTGGTTKILLHMLTSTAAVQKVLTQFDLVGLFIKGADTELLISGVPVAPGSMVNNIINSRACRKVRVIKAASPLGSQGFSVGVMTSAPKTQTACKSY